MKKLMMMVAAAAMSCGAWAVEYEYSYTWNVNIRNIDSAYQLPEDLTVQLYDTNNKLIAELTRSMFGSDSNLAKYEEGEHAGEFIANVFADAHRLNTSYTSGELHLSDDDINTGMKMIHMQATFKTSDNLGNLYNDKRGATDSLYVVLSGTVGGVKEYQFVDVGWEKADANGFGAAAKYETTTVPEPTSGMLMLLGLVGLALKRKRAA